MITDQQETHLERVFHLASPVRHVSTQPPVYHEPITHKLVPVAPDADLDYGVHHRPVVRALRLSKLC